MYLFPVFATHNSVAADYVLRCISEKEAVLEGEKKNRQSTAKYITDITDSFKQN